MNVGGIAEALQQTSSGVDRSLVFRADSDFGSTLTLGQIIKGKVLRHYDDSRYGVNFGGREKVVDSTTPLKVGDMVQGRVIRLDDKVHLQRIVDGQNPEKQQASNQERGILQQGSSRGEEIAALFSRYQASLSASDQNLISKLQGRLGRSGLVATSALVQSKLGLPLEAPLIEAIHRVLQQLESGRRGATSDIGIQLQGGTEASQPDSSLVQKMGPLLAQLAELIPTATNDDSEAINDGVDNSTGSTGAHGERQDTGGGNQSQEWLFGQWLLNTQSEGAVGHRFMRIPLWFGDRLVEVSLALFTQRDMNNQPQDTLEQALRYRKAVFTLDTENLGHVEIEVLAADRHLNLEINAESLKIAETLGAQLSMLAASLVDHGWHVDEIRYQVQEGSDSNNGVARAVVEHYINQDSFSQLM